MTTREIGKERPADARAPTGWTTPATDELRRYRQRRTERKSTVPTARYTEAKEVVGGTRGHISR